MRIWITGAEGMLGTALCQLCEQRSIFFKATGRLSGDVTCTDTLYRLAREICPTHIVNCAAYTLVDDAEQQAQKAFTINAAGAENIAAVAQTVGAKLVHISTDYVFNGANTVPYRENDECGPINAYGHSKWEAEKRIAALFPEACMIRTSWLFGKGGKNFISSLLQWMKERESIQVVCDQYGRPTYCRDLAEAVLKLLDSQGMWHFANEDGASRYEIAREVFKTAQEMGVAIKCQRIEPVKSSAFPTAAKRPLYSVLDTEKIAVLLGIKPRSWKDAFKEYLSYESS